MSYNQAEQLSTKEPSAKQDALQRIIEQFPDSPIAKALELVNGARRRDYGHPRDNFRSIANGWNNYLNTKYPRGGGWQIPMLSNDDVAMMMVIMKVLRQAITPKDDNLVDIAGYAECAYLAKPEQIFGGMVATPGSVAGGAQQPPKRNATLKGKKRK